MKMNLNSTAMTGAILALALAGCSQPAEDDAATGDTANTTEAPADGIANIVETASKSDEFSTLITAIEAAGLTETLSGPGPFTVFAPTNESFNRLDQNILQDLLKPENSETLKTILSFHVVPGKVMYDDLKDGQTLETIAGQTLTVTEDGDSKLVEGDLIVGSDIEASNGIIHVPFNVLMSQ